MALRAKAGRARPAQGWCSPPLTETGLPTSRRPLLGPHACLGGRKRARRPAWSGGARTWRRRSHDRAGRGVLPQSPDRACEGCLLREAEGSLGFAVPASVARAACCPGATVGAPGSLPLQPTDDPVTPRRPSPRDAGQPAGCRRPKWVGHARWLPERRRDSPSNCRGAIRGEARMARACWYPGAAYLDPVSGLWR
jgi:hypothetical protein